MSFKKSFSGVMVLVSLIAWTTSRVNACEFVKPNGLVMVPVLVAIGAPIVAGFAFAANGFVQSCLHANPTIKAAGIIAGSALGIEWVTHNIRHMPKSIHQIFGYGSRIGACGLMGYGLYKAIADNNSKAGCIISCLGAACVGFGMLTNQFIFKYLCIDPSILLFADAYRREKSCTRTTY